MDKIKAFFKNVIKILVMIAMVLVPMFIVFVGVRSYQSHISPIAPASCFIGDARQLLVIKDPLPPQPIVGYVNSSDSIQGTMVIVMYVPSPEGTITIQRALDIDEFRSMSVVEVKCE